MKRQHYIICYDIREPERLRRVHAMLKSMGLFIQYSVYYVHCSLRDLHALLKKIGAVMTASDDVRVYRLPNTQCINHIKAATNAPLADESILIIQ